MNRKVSPQPESSSAALSAQTEGFFRKPQLAVSVTECTGLCQTPVRGEGERQSFTDLYGIPLAVQGPPETDPPADARQKQGK